MEHINDLLKLVRMNSRDDIKIRAFHHLLSLTQSVTGIELFLAEDGHIIEELINSEDKSAMLCLVNLSTGDANAIKLYELAYARGIPLIDKAVNAIISPNSALADNWCMLLSNLTRCIKIAELVLTRMESKPDSLANLIKAFATLKYNKQGCKLHYLGLIFCNLTQLKRGREILTKSRFNLLNKILPFTSYEASILRRNAAIGIFKNICFDSIYHEVILKDDNDDVLTALLYPLCGPEEFNDEEMDKLPIALQFLPDTKTRENLPEHRKMLLECLLQLCATKRCRELLRNKGVYEILRELHKWEAASVGRNNECLLACENVVDILLNKESEIGLDNISDVQVPEDIAKKIEQDNVEYVKDLIE